jgi:hypothetical protein
MVPRPFITKEKNKIKIFERKVYPGQPFDQVPEKTSFQINSKPIVDVTLKEVVYRMEVFSFKIEMFKTATVEVYVDEKLYKNASNRLFLLRSIIHEKAPWIWSYGTRSDYTELYSYQKEFLESLMEESE